VAEKRELQSITGKIKNKNNQPGGGFCLASCAAAQGKKRKKSTWLQQRFVAARNAATHKLHHGTMKERGQNTQTVKRHKKKTITIK